MDRRIWRAVLAAVVVASVVVPRVYAVPPLPDPDPALSWGAGAAIPHTGARACSQALARTDSAAGTVLIAAYQSGAGATVATAGAYVRRSKDGGRSWSSPLRLSTTTPWCPAVAANGKTVVVAWLDRAATTAPRLAIRVSANYGLTFGATRFVPAPRSPDAPSVAISGTRIHVAWTDHANGTNGRIARLGSSADGGTTWTVRTLDGTPVLQSGPGWRSGGVALTATGGTVLAAWTRHAGVVVARSSRDYGRTWSLTAGLGRLAPVDAGMQGACGHRWTFDTCTVPAVAVSNLAVGGRRWLAVAWPGAHRTDAGPVTVHLRTMHGTTWDPLVEVTDDLPVDYARVRGVRLAFGAGTGLGMAWIGCRDLPCSDVPDDATDPDDVIWRRRSDVGTAWTPGSVLDTGLPAETARQAGHVSIAWTPGTWFVGALMERLGSGPSLSASEARSVRGVAHDEDGSPPTITMQSPPSGATGVPRDVEARVEIDEMVRWAAGSTGPLRIRDLTTDELVDTGYSFGFFGANTLPGMLLVPGRRYRAEMVRAVDMADDPLAARTWEFTITTDGTRPVLVAATPGPGAMDVSVAVTPTVTFSEAIRDHPDAELWLRRVEASTLIGVAATVTVDATGRTVTLEPDEPLLSATTYELVARSVIRDLAGNRFAGSTWRFTTAP